MVCHKRHQHRGHGVRDTKHHSAIPAAQMRFQNEINDSQSSCLSFGYRKCLFYYSVIFVCVRFRTAKLIFLPNFETIFDIVGICHDGECVNTRNDSDAFISGIVSSSLFVNISFPIFSCQLNWWNGRMGLLNEITLFADWLRDFSRKANDFEWIPSWVRSSDWFVSWNDGISSNRARSIKPAYRLEHRKQCFR